MNIGQLEARSILRQCNHHLWRARADGFCGIKRQRARPTTRARHKRRDSGGATYIDEAALIIDEGDGAVLRDAVGFLVEEHLQRGGHRGRGHDVRGGRDGRGRRGDGGGRRGGGYVGGGDADTGAGAGVAGEAGAGRGVGGDGGPRDRRGVPAEDMSGGLERSGVDAVALVANDSNGGEFCGGGGGGKGSEGELLVGVLEELGRELTRLMV